MKERRRLKETSPHFARRSPTARLFAGSANFLLHLVKHRREKNVPRDTSSPSQRAFDEVRRASSMLYTVCRLSRASRFMLYTVDGVTPERVANSFGRIFR